MHPYTSKLLAATGVTNKKHKVNQQQNKVVFQAVSFLKALHYGQGQTGRVFQLRVGSDSGIEKIFRVRLGIGYLYQIPSQLGVMGY